MSLHHNSWVDLKAIGRNIKKHRTQLDLTQEKLAEKVDCSWRYVQAIEQGNRIPSIRWLNNLSERLKIPLSELVKVK